MIQLDIRETGRTIYMPSDLAECDARQYAEACLLIYRYQQGELNYFDFRVEMVYKLLNLKRAGGKLVESEVEDMHSNIFRISELVDSFFELDPEDNTRIIKQYYIHNHTPFIKDTNFHFKGPADDFDDVDFGQYLEGLNLLAWIQQDPNEELYYRLAATFFIPEKAEGYSAKFQEENWKRFKRVHFGRVYGFYLLFTSFQKYLYSAKVYYQGNELDLSILFEGEEPEKKSDIPGLGLLSTAHQLAETGVYGPMEQVERTNMWKVILKLYDMRKRDLDWQAENKNKNTSS